MATTEVVIIRKATQKESLWVMILVATQFIATAEFALPEKSMWLHVLQDVSTLALVDLSTAIILEQDHL